MSGRSGPQPDATTHLQGVDSLAHALRFLLAAHAHRTGRKKTDLIMSMVSLPTWYSHLSGSSFLSPSTFEIYCRELTISGGERAVLARFYNEYCRERAKTGSQFSRSGAKIKPNNSINLFSSDFAVEHDIEAFFEITQKCLDSRLNDNPAATVFADTISAIESGEIYSGNADEKRAKILYVSYLQHLKAYNTADFKLQQSALSKIAQYAGLSGNPQYEYIRRATRLYAVNPQDLTWNSSHTFGANLQLTLLDEFKKLGELVGLTGLGSDKYLSKLSSAVSFSESAASYNVSSLELEISRGQDSAAIDAIIGIDKKDADSGVPFYSSVYNWFPMIEYWIFVGEFEKAIAKCDEGISRLHLSGIYDRMTETQFHLKRAKAIYSIIESYAPRYPTNHVDSLFSEFDGILHSSARHNNMSVFEEIAKIRSVLSIRYSRA